MITSASDLEELGEPGHVLPWRKSRINKSILKGFSTYLASSESWQTWIAPLIPDGPGIIW